MSIDKRVAPLNFQEIKNSISWYDVKLDKMAWKKYIDETDDDQFEFASYGDSDGILSIRGEFEWHINRKIAVSEHIKGLPYLVCDSLRACDASGVWHDFSRHTVRFNIKKQFCFHMARIVADIFLKRGTMEVFDVSVESLVEGARPKKKVEVIKVEPIKVERPRSKPEVQRQPMELKPKVKPNNNNKKPTAAIYYVPLQVLTFGESSDAMALIRHMNMNKNQSLTDMVKKFVLHHYKIVEDVMDIQNMESRRAVLHIIRKSLSESRLTVSWDFNNLVNGIVSDYIENKLSDVVTVDK